MRIVTAAIIAVIAAALPALAAPDLDADAAYEALRAGNAQDAKARFESAARRNPSDHAAVIALASTLPAADALKIMDSLSRVQSAPGWVKARGLRFLGDHRFVMGDYKKAADFYRQASTFDNSSAYRHLYALSMAADGQTDAAIATWAAIAADSADGMSAEAEALLRQIAPAKPQTAPVGPQTAPVNQQVAPAGQPTAAQQEKAVAYTVQVGAFGSRENADNLVKRLAGAYGDVYVSPTASGDQTLYRVRIGSFSRREDADSLANKLLTGAGLSARVFEK